VRWRIFYMSRFDREHPTFSCYPWDPGRMHVSHVTLAIIFVQEISCVIQFDRSGFRESVKALAPVWRVGSSYSSLTTLEFIVLSSWLGSAFIGLLELFFLSLYPGPSFLIGSCTACIMPSASGLFCGFLRYPVGVFNSGPRLFVGFGVR